jgi:hypothetical protein
VIIPFAPTSMASVETRKMPGQSTARDDDAAEAPVRVRDPTSQLDRPFAAEPAKNGLADEKDGV